MSLVCRESSFISTTKLLDGPLKTLKLHAGFEIAAVSGGRTSWADIDQSLGTLVPCILLA